MAAMSKMDFLSGFLNARNQLSGFLFNYKKTASEKMLFFK